MRPPYNGKNDIHFFRKKGCHYLLLIPLLIAWQRTNAQVPVIISPTGVITHTVTFNQSDLQISDIEGADNNAYERVSYPGLPNSEKDPGSPSLPVKYVHLIVPRDKNYSKITVEESSVPVSINLSRPVFPVQYPLPTADDYTAPPFVAPEPEIYNTESPYPSVLVKYIGEGYSDGNKHIITLAIYPAIYAAQPSRLDFYSSITFKVEENPDVPVNLHSISRPPVASQELYHRPLEQLVANPDDIPLYAGMTAEEMAAATEAAAAAKGTAAFYEYVIITSHELRPAFEELLGWKRRKGLNAGIVEIQDILSAPAYSSGDAISGINDDAGKLRAYLQDAWRNGTIYAVLGGDDNVIPIRYAAGLPNLTYDPIWAGNCHIPSDLYYTDFNGDWNVDNDAFFAEDFEDIVDYSPEIFVGRILANTTMEATNLIHKIIRYERNPGRGDNDYLTIAFMAQADEMEDGYLGSDDHQAEAVTSHLTFFAPGDVNIWNEAPSGGDPNPTGPSPVNVIQEIEKHYGLVSLLGHGSPNNIAVTTHLYNKCIDGQPLKQKVTCIDAIDGWCAPIIAGNGLDNLDDFDHVIHPYHSYPHIFYTTACETVPFDDELKDPGSPDMGEVYTKYHKAGAAAYLGNTRNGWVTNSYELYMNFADQLVTGNHHIGIAEGFSKSIFPSFSDTYTWIKKTHSIVGCPETEMWTAKPASFTGATVSGSGGTVTVSTGGITDATICIISELDNGQTYQQRINNTSSHTFTGVPARYAVCITRHNYIPYLWTSNVIVQNHDFYGTAYLAAPNDIASGSNVDQSQPTGPVIVKKDANVFFHADNKGTILLDKGFEVEPGAAFEAK